MMAEAGTASVGGEMESESEIRALFDRWAAAIRAKDADGSLANYGSDVCAFDLIEPLQYSGSDAVRERLENWFSSFEGPIRYENRDLRITAGADVAFGHSLNHVAATTKDGQTLDMWWRATVCLRNVRGEWVVTHSHASVPFHMETGKASLDLKP
jgi:uncharacterized protein (TIGR02246 family)